MDARLTLFGEPVVPAWVAVEARSAWTRRTRAVAVLFGTWALMPVVFFIPPHAEWVVLAFFGGIYLARREWTAEYVVRSFEGGCPRCGSALVVAAGTRLRFPYDVSCGACRRTSTLESGPVTAGASGTSTVHGDSAAPPSDLDVVAHDAYWRGRSRTSVWSPASSDWRGGWDRRRGS